MESLATIESFVRSAEARSFSAAARKLGVSPAAVSKNVAKLESRLGVRLFQRSTRSLTLTEPGERFLGEATAGLASLQSAMDNLTHARSEPAGRLRVSMPSAFGRDYVMPALPAFVARYPAIELDFQLDNKRVDLIGDGFDAAIGGSLELGAGIITRELSRAHIVFVASPSYLQAHGTPRAIEDLQAHHGVALRSPLTGRLRSWNFRHTDGTEAVSSLRPRAVFDDMDAVCQGALLGLGIGTTVMSAALPHFERGTLVRVLPRWFAESGAISIYFASQKLLPTKTRAFVDFIVAHARKDRWATRFRAG